MAQEGEYDYSKTKHHMEPFINPFLNKPFFEEMEETYGALWEFKEHIATWSFGVNRWKDFVYLRYRVHGKEAYLPWNMNEKVTVIEDHREDYVVIVLREVDDNGKPGKHSHSLILDVKAHHGKFDLQNLMTFLEGSQVESLNEEFENAGYVPWKHSTAKSNANRLRLIWQALDHYAVKNVEKRPPVGGAGSRAQKSAGGSARSHSGAGATGSRGATPAQARSDSRKPVQPTSGAGDSNRKRRKSNLPSNPVAAGSSGSGLTTVEASQLESDTPMEEYEKFALLQRNFWAEHESCFLFESETVKVNINQCLRARDEYIIRTLQRDIVDTVKKELVQMIDVKQRQKVCLTPVDENNNLLKTKPARWEQIMSGNFMIINGQHSITAAKELQEAGCGEERKALLRTWDAFIVWTLDAAKLTNISKFYNCTNHLDHAQPTWGNQIISCRNIWVSCKRPSADENEAVTRRNKAVYSLTNYAVSNKP
jgi:hypothetical protein